MFTKALALAAICGLTSATFAERFAFKMRRRSPTKSNSKLRSSSPSKFSTFSMSKKPTSSKKTKLTATKKKPTTVKKTSTVKKTVKSVPKKDTSKSNDESLSLMKKSVKAAQKIADSELDQYRKQQEALNYLVSQVDMYANTAASVNTPVTKIHRSVVKIKNEFANMYSKINKYNGTLAAAVSDYGTSVGYLGRLGDWETRIEKLESAQ